VTLTIYPQVTRWRKKIDPFFQAPADFLGSPDTIIEINAGRTIVDRSKVIAIPVPGGADPKPEPEASAKEASLR
jgi:hypothetical protein